jgi:hypothetical protein
LNIHMRSLYIDYDGYSEAEIVIAKSLERNLNQLSVLALEFRSTVHLYLLCFQQRELIKDVKDQYGLRDLKLFSNVSDWFTIVGRNGAILCYSYDRLISEINSCHLRQIKERVDFEERKKGTKLFHNQFKDIKKVRNSSAHPGEFTKNPEGFEKHCYKMGGRIYIQNMMNAGEDELSYGSTVEGKFVNYRLSEQKADILDRVTEHYFKAYYPLQHPDTTQSLEWHAELDRQRALDQSNYPPWWHILLPKFRGHNTN